jgi:Na+/proline symporter
MELGWEDRLIVAGYLLLSISLGLFYSRDSGKNATAFFGSSRRLGWLPVGLSMVATTFAADTPLAVTELVRKHGISGNWLWWNALIGGMFTVFFTARYWHRAGVVTDLELITIRYSGAAARWLRRFKAIWLGLVINACIIGWVNLAMASVLSVLFGISAGAALVYTGILLLITGLYTAAGGLQAVIITDAVQFVLAMVGCIVLAIYVVSLPAVGGIAGITEKIPAEKLAFFPAILDSQHYATAAAVENSGGTLSWDWLVLCTFLGVQWWASWYPGAEPGGGGYIVQRIFATRSPQEGQLSVLFFQLAHYLLRPWPWIITALATLILYPQWTVDREAFVFCIRDHMPVGGRGLLLASFLAAYMSTVATQLNWGASYLIQDWLKPQLIASSEGALVWAGRTATVLMMVLAYCLTWYFDSVASVWHFVLASGAGTGGVLILRWFWWRVSAWSEILATIVPVCLYVLFQVLFWQVDEGSRDSLFQFPYSYLLTVAFTTMIWIIGTYLLPGTDSEVLHRFCEKVRPIGRWGKYTHADAQKNTRRGGYRLGAWILGVLGGYSLLIGIGQTLLGYETGLLLLLIAIMMLGGMWYCMRRTDESEEVIN